jgi:hypothetical protein
VRISSQERENSIHFVASPNLVGLDGDRRSGIVPASVPKECDFSQHCRGGVEATAVGNAENAR